MKGPKCAIISIMRIACYIIPVWTLPEIGLSIVYVVINQLKYCLCLGIMGKYCTRVWSRGIYSTWLCLMLYWTLNHALEQYFLKWTRSGTLTSIYDSLCLTNNCFPFSHSIPGPCSHFKLICGQWCNPWCACEGDSLVRSTYSSLITITIFIFWSEADVLRSDFIFPTLSWYIPLQCNRQLWNTGSQGCHQVLNLTNCNKQMKRNIQPSI